MTKSFLLGALMWTGTCLIMLHAQDNSSFKLSDIRVRDPFIYADVTTKTYYLYAQVGNRLLNDHAGVGVEAYTSTDLKNWSGPKLVMEKPKDFWGGNYVWAPEVHRFGQSYYMFVTFDRPGGRGTQIFKAPRPDGPFVVLGPLAMTPPEQQCLDGTPWVDESGQNWLIYCEEWTRVKDGAMRAIHMKSDWSQPDGKDILLFHASDAPWAYPVQPDCYVTDGPFLHKTASGKLVMIWSSYMKNGSYALGLARSTSGKVEGPWIQNPTLLFNKDGGHAMIFKDFDGHLMLVLHQPNIGKVERAHLFQLDDSDELRLKAN